MTKQRRRKSNNIKRYEKERRKEIIYGYWLKIHRGAIMKGLTRHVKNPCCFWPHTPLSIFHGLGERRKNDPGVRISAELGNRNPLPKITTPLWNKVEENNNIFLPLFKTPSTYLGWPAYKFYGKLHMKFLERLVWNRHPDLIRFFYQEQLPKLSICYQFKVSPKKRFWACVVKSFKKPLEQISAQQGWNIDL